jgi:hypothetical protein
VLKYPSRDTGGTFQNEKRQFGAISLFVALHEITREIEPS